MAVQDTYNDRIDAVREGMPGDTGHKVVISRTVEGAAIGFGKPVVQGAESYGVRAPTTGDTAVLGVTAWDRGVFADSFSVGESARVFTEGVIAIKTAVAVTAGDPVHVVVADGTFSNTGGVELPGARFEQDGAADSLVKIRL